MALTSVRRLAPFVVLAAAASVYAGVKTIPLYLRLAAASDARLAALEATPRGGVLTADSFGQVEDNWWFLGDDFRDVRKRQLVTEYFALSGVLFRAVDIEAPLGVSDVRFRPRYKLSPPSCLDEHGGLELGAFRGIDIKATHDAVLAGIAALRQRIVAAGGALDELELEVGFVGAPPAGLPERRVIVGRWRPDRYEGWSARIERAGIGKTRTVRLPKELAGTDAEILLYQVGGETRRLGAARDRLDYVPWKQPAAYWVLACPARDPACFVVAATRLQ